MNATPIGIAIVESAGRYLVGQRGEDVPLPGMWEFPGGKCLAGESPAECAVRECREETGLAVRTIAELHRVTHAYAHGEVELHFWMCEPVDASAVADSHNGYRWVAGRELGGLEFPEANAAVLELLANRR